jgi:HlyD family secretion protein
MTPAVPVSGPAGSPAGLQPATPGVQRPAPKVPQAPPKNRHRWILLLIFGLAASVGLVLGARLLARRSSASAENGIPTAKTTRGNLRKTIRLTGVIAARQAATLVAPRLQGRGPGGGGADSQLILIKLAAVGTPVKKGDAVAEFDRQWQLMRVDDRKAEVVQAEAAIAKRQAELAVEMEAERQLVRTTKADLDKAKLDLRTTDIRSAIDAEKMKLAVEEAEARYAQLQQEIKLKEESGTAEVRGLEMKRDSARIDMRRAEVNAERMIMRAPIDGVPVTQMTWRGGTFAQVQEGDQLFPGSSFLQIVDPSVMLVNAAANQAESEQFRLGQTGEIRLDAYPGEVWKGRLVSMGAMAVGSAFGGRGGSRALFVRQVPVRFSIDGRDPRIIPDLSASVSVLLKEEKNTVVAPRAALQREGGEYYVRVKGPSGGWEKRKVKVGLTNDTEAAILSGLREEEEVALAPEISPQDAPAR